MPPSQFVKTVINVTTSASASCRIGAGLTQCTFYISKQRETQQNDLANVYYSQYITDIRVCITNVTDITDVTDLKPHTSHTTLSHPQSRLPCKLPYKLQISQYLNRGIYPEKP